MTPPVFRVLPLSVIRGEVVVFVSVEPATDIVSKSDVIVLFVAWSSGPARSTFAGATSSLAGAPAMVSETAKKAAPDCESAPITVELESWISGLVVVLISSAP